MRVLGIETSCDETSAAVLRDARVIESHVIASQVPWHQVYGGVVPEIASRKHIEWILPVIHRALDEAGGGPVDAIAVTYGPGLVGGLLVGIAAAKALSLAWKVPLVGVNHIEGHIYANILHDPEIQPPLVCLTVSGGHTDLLYLPRFGQYQIIGRTQDDAAGEAFDKVARVLGLGYPGGPAIEKAALSGDPRAYSFPRPMLHGEGYHFSFSGLKTAVINQVHQLRQKEVDLPIPDLAASFQAAALDMLQIQTIKAVTDLRVKTLLLSGGVAANTALRERFMQATQELGVALSTPPLVLCTDNAAMIACAGTYRLQEGYTSPPSLNAVPNLRL